MLNNPTNIVDVVRYGKALDLNHEKLYFKTTINDTDKNNIVLNYKFMVDEYLEFIKSHTVNYTMTDDELAKYKYQPKLFCYDIYNTVEIWSLILRINYMVSPLDFTRKNIKIFNPDVFVIINEMLILEKDDYETNLTENEIKK